MIVTYSQHKKLICFATRPSSLEPAWIITVRYHNLAVAWIYYCSPILHAKVLLHNILPFDTFTIFNGVLSTDTGHYTLPTLFLFLLRLGRFLEEIYNQADWMEWRGNLNLWQGQIHLDCFSSETLYVMIVTWMQIY